MHRLSLVVVVTAGLLASLLAAPVKAQTHYPEAPPWEISEWINSDGVTLEDLKGKVVVIDFFQLWCPGCKAFSIPLMDHWEKVFAKERIAGRIAFISIHTVFEGHAYQTPARLRKFVKEKGITHPVGIDKHVEGRRTPVTMRRYNTGGTPEMALIDSEGRIRFQQFGYFEPDHGTALIRTMLEEQLKPKNTKLN